MGGVSGFIHTSDVIGPSVTGLLVQAPAFLRAFVLAGTIAALGVLTILIYFRRSSRLLLP